MNSNKINWPAAIIEAAARLGYRPFCGYWVKVGDDRLYLLEEILERVEL